MSVKVYRTYDSDIAALFVEDSGETVGFPTEFNNKTLAQLTGSFPCFDGTATVFTSYNSIAAALVSAGWSNVLSLEGYSASNPRIFYMNATHTLYIKAWYTGSIIRVRGYEVTSGGEISTELISTSYVGGTLTYGTTVASNDSTLPINTAYTSATTQNASGYFTNGTGSTAALLKDFWDKCSVFPTDPYSPGGPSEPGGGGGTFDDTSDSNPIPSDPTISATDTGFMTAFATNLAGIQSLAASLWSDIFSAIQPGGTLEGTVEALKNIVASPYDAILGCHIIPVAVAVGASKNVKLYGVLPSTVSLPVAASQWVHKDCGTLTIEPYDGSYLDYAPYSKVTSLYLPFVGVVSVDIDIIMNTTIGVYYKIDIISGQCIAFITKNGDVYFQYQGQCAVPLPVTSVDWSTTVSAGLGIVGSIGSIAGSAVGGALGGGGAAGALAGAVKGTIGEAGSIAQNVMNSKPDIKSGSGVGGSAALMGCKNPYLIIERPRKSTPAIDDLYQNHWTGYPSNIAARIGDLEGYTEVSRVFVNRTNATAAEKQEIERLLNEGVYL